MTAALFTLADAAALLPGAAPLGDPSTPILRVHSDTRTLRPGDLFVALRGDNFDAHAFLPQARAAAPPPRWPSMASPMPACPACRWPTAWWRCSSWPPAGACASPAR